MRIIDAAKYIIHLSYSVKSRSLTLGKLQAVLYLSQGWSYVWDNAPPCSKKILLQVNWRQE